MKDKFFEYLKETFKDVMNQYTLLKKHNPKLDHEGAFMKEFLPIYFAYRSEKYNRRLVWATWALAIATMVLVIISFFVN